MMSKTIATVVVALLAWDAAAFGEPIDWPSFFHDVLSRDAGIQESAREKGLSIIAPQLCTESPEKLSADIPGLVAQLSQKNADIRIQASAFLVTIARVRLDSASTLSSALPALVDHVRDSTAQVRQNSVTALSVLRPDLSSALLPVFLGLVHGEDAVVQPGAIFAIARLANTNAEAEQTLKRLLSIDSSPANKKLAIQAIPGAAVTTAPVLLALGALLSDKDIEISRAALLAMNRSGKDAIALNRYQIAQFAQTSPDKQLTELAYKLLDDTR